MLTHDGLALTLCGKYDGRERHIPSTMRSHLQLRNPLQHSGSPASVPYYRNVKYMHTKAHCESPYGVHTQHPALRAFPDTAQHRRSPSGDSNKGLTPPGHSAHRAGYPATKLPSTKPRLLGESSPGRSARRPGRRGSVWLYFGWFRFSPGCVR